MVAAIQHTKLSAMLEDLLETDAALLVKAVQRVPLVVVPHLRRVIVPAIVSISAVASLIVLTGGKSVRVLQEEVNDLIIIRHVLKLLLRDGRQTCFTLNQLLSVEYLLIHLLLLIQEGVMLDDIVNIVYLWVILRLHFRLRCCECLLLTLRHHKLLREIDAFRDGTSKICLR